MELLRITACRVTAQARSLTRVINGCMQARHLQHQNRILASSFHTSGVRMDLMEFFDDEKNWKKDEVLVGRPWKMDELRIKSNTELHKLWYVLLKERNMLMTMEHLYDDAYLPMPSPERMEKVEESMENLMEVIRERDVAFNKLETGKTGEPEVRTVLNFMGLRVERTEEEHQVPKEMNKKYKLLYPEKFEKWMKPYLRLHDEHLRLKKRKLNAKLKKRRKELLEKFPDLSEEDLEHGLDEIRQSAR